VETDKEPRNLDMGLVVADMDTMTAFYTSGLGFRQIGDRAAALGRLRRFSCKGAYVKFLLPTQPAAHANLAGGPGGGALGLQWFSITVDDLEAQLERCVELGATVTTPITDTPVGLRYALLEDPEGNWLELVEETPGREP
jgi:predicted enzyme related to lactoylglutathione lyase